LLGQPRLWIAAALLNFFSLSKVYVFRTEEDYNTHTHTEANWITTTQPEVYEQQRHPNGTKDEDDKRTTDPEPTGARPQQSCLEEPQ
jgi:hypothetical protein